MDRPTYDWPLAEWLATVHDTVERMAERASEDDRFDTWEWIYEETDNAVDIDGSTNADGYLTAAGIGGLIYLGSSTATGSAILPGVTEVDADAARWFETFDPAAIMARVTAERAVVAEWTKVGDDREHRNILRVFLIYIAAGWNHMPGYLAEWTPVGLPAAV